MIEGRTVLCVRSRSMYRPFNVIAEALDRFERWFNERFGWFFTNGMKGMRRRDAVGVSASGRRSSPR